MIRILLAMFHSPGRQAQMRKDWITNENNHMAARVG